MSELKTFINKVLKNLVESEDSDGLKVHMFWMEELFRELSNLPKHVSSVVMEDVFKNFEINNEAMIR